MNYTFTSWDSELYHHGIKGQKWGIRRYQNEDGTLTEAGKKRYGAYYDEQKVSAKKVQRDFNKLESIYASNAAKRVGHWNHGYFTGQKLAKRRLSGASDDSQKSKRLKEQTLSNAHKFNQSLKDEVSIGELEKKVLQKALDSGYTLSSRPVVAYRSTGRNFVDWFNDNPLVRDVPVSGVRVKVSSIGDKSINLYNYNTRQYEDYRDQINKK